MKNDTLAKNSAASKTEANIEVPKFEKENFKSDVIVNSFAESYQNICESEKLGIKAPVSYMDIPVEMEEYRENYDKFVRIVNEYVHNVQQSREKKDE